MNLNNSESRLVFNKADDARNRTGKLKNRLVNAAHIEKSLHLQLIGAKMKVHKSETVVTAWILKQNNHQSADIIYNNKPSNIRPYLVNKLFDKPKVLEI